MKNKDIFSEESFYSSKAPHLIEVENVTKVYKMGDVSISALDGVNFTVDEGEFVVVLGASGAGKSTILNLIGGMDTVTSGSIKINGIDITKSTTAQMTLYRRYCVGFVFQFYNLIANLTAIENVEFAASVKRTHLDAQEMIEAVGLADRCHNFPSQLSGGEQQRVAIARAVAKDPLLLLCDEPTGALDDKTGKRVLKLLEQVNRDNKKTIMLITHNTAIAPIADKIIRVRSGRIESIDINENPQEVDSIEL